MSSQYRLVKAFDGGRIWAEIPRSAEPTTRMAKAAMDPVGIHRRFDIYPAALSTPTGSALIAFGSPSQTHRSAGRTGTVDQT